MTENSATRTETNREIIRQAFDAWRQGTGAITDVFAPDMVWRIEDTRPHRKSTAAGSSLSMRSWPRSAPGSRCQSHSARSRSARSTPTTSLTDRGLRSAASASSSCVSRASARSCRSSPAKLSAACSATSPASPPHSPGNLPPGYARPGTATSPRGPGRSARPSRSRSTARAPGRSRPIPKAASSAHSCVPRSRLSGCTAWWRTAPTGKRRPGGEPGSTGSASSGTTAGSRWRASLACRSSPWTSFRCPSRRP